MMSAPSTSTAPSLTSGPRTTSVARGASLKSAGAVILDLKFAKETAKDGWKTTCGGSRSAKPNTENGGYGGTVTPAAVSALMPAS